MVLFTMIPPANENYHHLPRSIPSIIQDVAYQYIQGIEKTI